MYLGLPVFSWHIDCKMLGISLCILMRCLLAGAPGESQEGGWPPGEPPGH